eukprot:s2243_g11.t1
MGVRRIVAPECCAFRAAWVKQFVALAPKVLCRKWPMAVMPWLPRRPGRLENHPFAPWAAVPRRYLQPMATLPRDSLVARMLQRGTLPAWNLFDKVPKEASWPSPVASQASQASTAPGKASAAPSSASTSVGTTSASSLSKSSCKTPSRPLAAPAPSAPVAAATTVGSTVVALAKKIRHSLGKALVSPRPALLKLPKLPKPTHRKVGKQRPSVPPKPRHRKTGKQRPSHLAVPPAVQLPRPPPPPRELSATARAALAAVAVPAVPAAPAGRKNSAGPGPVEKKKSQSQERPPITPKKRSSAAIAAAAAVAPITKRMKLTTVKREEDNYEISDMEEDEDGNRIEPDRQGKRIPAWCANYATVATSQADIDPDSIFGTRMPLCDLLSLVPRCFDASRDTCLRSEDGTKQVLVHREGISSGHGLQARRRPRKGGGVGEAPSERSQMRWCGLRRSRCGSPS